ncbi:MAG: arginine decarboxylase, pyruvoyl-dependent [Methanobacteriaceae archaeon]|nr:arginine decarboxylase, pyruvoyl-dependent [Methanobacteriaceae archaeon]
MKISLTAGKSEGPTKLNAFDNALTDAKIGDVNLIPVSSMLPPNTQIINMPHLDPGAMTNCVLSHQHSNTPGDKISAVLSIAQAKEMGCVTEISGTNIPLKELEKESKFMVEYMMEKRNLEMLNLQTISKTHTVKENASVVAAVIYHPQL